MSSSSEALMQPGGTGPAENARTCDPAYPPCIPMTFNVGVTGHRHLAAANRSALVDAVGRILILIKQALAGAKGKPDLGLATFSAEEPVRLRIVSSLAAGADQIVAAAGLELGYVLHCPLPFQRDQYALSFHDCAPQDAGDYRRLLDRAERVLELAGDYEKEPELAYLASGRVVVTYSDNLIAI